MDIFYLIFLYSVISIFFEDMIIIDQYLCLEIQDIMICNYFLALSLLANQ